MADYEKGNSNQDSRERIHYEREEALIKKRAIELSELFLFKKLPSIWTNKEEDEVVVDDSDDNPIDNEKRALKLKNSQDQVFIKMLGEYCAQGAAFRHHVGWIRILLNEHTELINAPLNKNKSIDKKTSEIDDLKKKFIDQLKIVQEKGKCNPYGTLALMCDYWDANNGNNEFSSALGLPEKRKRELFKKLDIDETNGSSIDVKTVIDKYLEPRFFSTHQKPLGKLIGECGKPPETPMDYYQIVLQYVHDNQYIIKPDATVVKMLAVLKDWAYPHTETKVDQKTNAESSDINKDGNINTGP